MGCSNCPLQHRTKIFSQKPENYTRAVVGDAPSFSEVAQRRHVAGQAGQLLRQTLKQTGLDTNSVLFTGVTLCSPERGQSVSDEAIQCCQERLFEEISGCERVLLCGASALKSVAPHVGKISDSRGLSVDLPELQTSAVITYHPAMILRDPFFFTDLARDIEKFAHQPHIDPPTLPSIHMCTRPFHIRDAVLALSKEPVVMLDLETTSLDPLTGQIVLMGLQGNEQECWQIPGNLLYSRYAQQWLNRLLCHSECQTGSHNVGFDSKWIKYQLGINWEPEIDTMLLHYTIDERSRDEEDDKKNSNAGAMAGVHGLKTLARERYNVIDYSQPLKQYLSDLGKQRRAEERAALKSGEEYTYMEPNYGDIPIEMLSPYLAGDTLYALKLAFDLRREASLDNTIQVHDQILVPAALALKDVEWNGVLINRDELLTADHIFREEIERDMQQLREFAQDDSFNVNSPKQVAHLLYHTLKLGGGKSTDKETLESLVDRHPAPQLILDSRQKERLRSTYIEGILSRLSADGRLRGEFLLHGTKTGRLSSRNPNLQNIPVLVGPVIRNAFVATPGWTMIEADYSQLELRVAAYYSHDERLMYAYTHGEDIHRLVASEVFGVPPEEVTQMQRYIAKYIDFGIIYGRQAVSLAHGELKCSVGEAQSYIDSFLAKFGGLRDWMQQTKEETWRTGFVQTAFGRKRRFPLILNSNREEIGRQAVNSPIQGMASDICLRSLTRLQKRLDPRDCRLLLTVHDSILFEARNDYLDTALQIIQFEMEENHGFESPVPFKVDIKTGSCWGKLDKRQQDKK